MEGEEFCHTHEDLVDPVTEIGPEAHDQGELSLMVILGHNKSPPTIKKHKFVVLVDSGSTHDFVHPRIAKTLSAQVEDILGP